MLGLKKREKVAKKMRHHGLQSARLPNSRPVMETMISPIVITKYWGTWYQIDTQFAMQHPLVQNGFVGSGAPKVDSFTFS